MRLQVKLLHFWLASVVLGATLGLPRLGASAEKPVAIAPPAPLDLPRLLQAFAQSPGLSARFIEKKQLALLAAPLESAGMLYFSPVAGLARQVERPERSILVVDSKQVRMFDGTRWEIIDLAGKPVVRMFVESFLRILQGDLPALRLMYAIELQREASTPHKWTLVLRPRLDPMNKLIDRLELRGERLILAQLKIVEVGGDETQTQFSEVQPTRVFSDAERTRFFPAPAK